MLTRSQKQKLIKLHVFLLKWGAKNRRSFVWRSKPSAYRILIAEFFLQRTKAAQAEKQYRLFIKKYPNFYSLRSVSTAELRRFFGPLGLRKRVAIFKKLVTNINKRCDGRLPRKYEKLISLPGIGDYTASAILLFTGKEKRGLVDANTIRIFSSLFGLKMTREDGKRSKFIKECAEYFSSLGKDPRMSNWLLLDYGATIDHEHRANDRKST